MATSDVSAKSFVTELMKISLDIVWKDPFVSIQQEPADIRMMAEAYIASRNGDLNFYSVFQFHEEVLKPFFPDKNELERVLNNKRLIPEILRDSIVAAERDFLIDYWENRDGETNEYYRLVFGLPPLTMDPSRYLYNTKYHDIDEETPLHMLQYVDRLKLENRGYFDELLADSTIAAEHPYLAYLGVKRIFPYIARQAEYYQLIYCPPSEYQYLRQDFMDIYEEARRMVLRVYYNDAYRNKSKLYEGFLGLLILFMTQQRLCEKYLEADISRNFYDLESLRLVYDAYGVPFYPSIPLKYHERIVKHINELISYKGSTQVFYDVFGLFDFGKMDVFEYYLVKDRKVNEWGNPIFRDSKGKHLSADQLWDLRFARVGWKGNKFTQVIDPENKVPYDYLTEPDPYWINDKELLDKLYSEDWNYFQSKYMGVQIMFDLSKLLFETSYFIHMLHDNREEMSAMTVYYMLTGDDIPVFDMIIYALALLCRNAGYTGEIPSDPASVAAVYGFNFLELNKLLKMATMTMDEWVINLKKKLHEFIEDNEILQYDHLLSFLIDAITDGAFNWLGSDFPYGEWLLAPPPVFLHDFTPTANSVENLRRYLAETIKLLNENDEMTTFEIMQLYQRYVSSDNWIFNVRKSSSAGEYVEYQQFIVKSHNWNEEDAETLRQAIIASYEGMLSYLIRLIDARTAMTFDPHILELISNMNLNNIEDIERVYKLMWDLDEYLTVKMRESHHMVDYETYANLRKILMTTKQVQESVTKKDGTIAKTYEDLLADINPELYEHYVSEGFDPQNEEDYVIQTLMRLCDDLTLLDMVNTSNIQRVVEHMFKILRFLKSAKVDLVDFRIMYLINGRTMNYIKLLGEIWEQDVNVLGPREKIDLETVIHATVVIQYLMDRLYLIDKVGADVRAFLDSWFEWFEDSVTVLIEQELRDGFQYLFDWLHTQKLTQVWRELCHITDRPEHQYFDITEFTKSYLALWDYWGNREIDMGHAWTTEVLMFRNKMKLTEVEQTLRNHEFFPWDWQFSDAFITPKSFLTMADYYRPFEMQQTIMRVLLMMVTGVRREHVHDYLVTRWQFLHDAKPDEEILQAIRSGMILMEGPDAFLPIWYPRSDLTLMTCIYASTMRGIDFTSWLPLWAMLGENHIEQERRTPLWLYDWQFSDVTQTPWSPLWFYDTYRRYESYRILMKSKLAWATGVTEEHMEQTFWTKWLYLVTRKTEEEVLDHFWTPLYLLDEPNPFEPIWYPNSWLTLMMKYHAADMIQTLPTDLPLWTRLWGSHRELQERSPLWLWNRYFSDRRVRDLNTAIVFYNRCGDVEVKQTIMRVLIMMVTGVNREHINDYLVTKIKFLHISKPDEDVTDAVNTLMQLRASIADVDVEQEKRSPLWLRTRLVDVHGDEVPDSSLWLWTRMSDTHVDQEKRSPLWLWDHGVFENEDERFIGSILNFFHRNHSEVVDYFTNRYILKDRLLWVPEPYIDSKLALYEHTFHKVTQTPLSELVQMSKLNRGPVTDKLKKDWMKLIDKIERGELSYIDWVITGFIFRDLPLVDVIDAFLEGPLISDGYLKTSVSEAPFNDAIMATDSLIKVDEKLVDNP